MTEDQKNTLTPAVINNQEMMEKLKQEVNEEFVTSDIEVYKEALRTLQIQDQKLDAQMAAIQKEKDYLDQSRKALDDAFTSGQLHSIKDARGITRRVSRNAATSEFAPAEDKLFNL